MLLLLTAWLCLSCLQLPPACTEPTGTGLQGCRLLSAGRGGEKGWLRFVFSMHSHAFGLRQWHEVPGADGSHRPGFLSNPCGSWHRAGQRLLVTPSLPHCSPGKELGIFCLFFEHVVSKPPPQPIEELLAAVHCVMPYAGGQRGPGVEGVCVTGRWV